MIFNISIRAVKLHKLPCVHVVALAARGDFTFAANGSYDSAVALFIYVDAESASLAHRECGVRCVNFIQVAFTQLANTKIHGPFSEAHLRNICIEIQERQRGHAPQVNARLPGLQFRS
jgi:hypothetical protein